MNDLMKEGVAAMDVSWSATLPLVLFVLFFIAVCVWTLRQPDVAPPLE